MAQSTKNVKKQDSMDHDFQSQLKGIAYPVQRCPLVGIECGKVVHNCKSVHVCGHQVKGN